MAGKAKRVRPAQRGGKRRYEVILAYLWLYEDAYQLISFISQRLEDMGFFSDLISSK